MSWAQQWLNIDILFGELDTSKAGAEKAKLGLTFHTGMEECCQRLDFETTMERPSPQAGLGPSKHDNKVDGLHS